MKKSFFGIFCIVLVISLTNPFVTRAQSPNTPIRQIAQNVSPTPITPPEQPTVGIDLSISPVFLTLVTDPDKPVSQNIRVTNNNNITEYLEIQLMRFAPDQNGNPTIVDLEENDEFRNWIDFSEQQFVVSPNESKMVRVTVDPPASASLGYYYALLITRINETDAGDRQAIVAGAPAMPLLLEVRSPNAKREMQLVDFKTDQMIYEYLPVKFEVTMKNTGNVHDDPSGDIFLDWGGQKNVAILPVNKGHGNVLPNTSRTFESFWEDGFAVRVPKMENGKEVKDSEGNPVYTTEYDFGKADKFRIGKYTARVIMVYNNGERDVPVEAKISFWVIPWKFLLVGLALLLFVFLGVRSVFSSIFKKRSK